METLGFILRLSSLLLALTATVIQAEQYSASFAIALFQDWDYRYHREPPQRQDVHIQTTTGNAKEKVMSFYGFGNTWTMKLQKNNILFGNQFSFDFIKQNGNINRQRFLSKDCFFIGTVTAGENEVGFASITTCNNNIRGYIITNKNDYAINPWIPETIQGRKRRDVNAEVRSKRYPKYDPNFVDGVWSDAHFEPLYMPKGRDLHLELGFSIEQSYKKAFQREVSTDENELLIHLALTAQNAQLWYIHPTLGYRFWFTVRKIVIVEDDWQGPDDRSLWGVCNWKNKNIGDAANWDGTVFMSDDLTYWNGGEGLGQVGGMCDDNSQNCVGVGKKGFQMSTLTRIIAHEMGHLLGMADSYYPPMSKLCYTGVMRQGVYEDHDWGVCGVQRMENFIHVRQKTCTQSTPSMKESPPRIPLNVAWRASAYQSSTYHNEKIWGAWKATDGAINGIPHLENNATLASCTQTLLQAKPWIVVELPDTYSNNKISNIHIYNREDCCEDRLNNFEVRIGHNSDFRRNALCKHHTGKVPGGKYGMVDIQCTGMSGKYISIQKMEQGILTVCEVNVFQDITAPKFNHADEPCLDDVNLCHDVRSQNKNDGTCQPNNEKTLSCRYTCGACDRYGLYKPPKLQSQDTSHPTVEPQPSCTDSNAYCRHWKAMGKCNESNMRSQCKKSCGYC